MAKYKRPFAALLPPLSTEEFAALKADIEANGVRDPVCLDEEGNVLDGHNRLEIDPDAPTVVIRGLSETEREAFVFRANFVRRNLSPSQKADLRAKMKATAKRLREEDPKRWTQAAVAAALGVARQTVSDWFGTNAGSGNASKPDARVKVNPTHKPVIAERIAAGESREQVAADYGISGRQAASIATKELKVKAEAERREKVAEATKTDFQGIYLGDFRGVSEIVDDESVDLVFTDPPYDKEAVELYADLAAFASRVLRPGSWCLAYSGHNWLPDVVKAMEEHLTFGWMFCCQHSGGDSRFRNLKLQVKWKPILGFYKPPISAWWDWFPDSVSGGKEKDKHEWQQAESEAAHFIKALTPKGGVVCDPFCGSGTTCAAAKRSGRKWVGFEIEEKHVTTARVRVKEVVA